MEMLNFLPSPMNAEPGILVQPCVLRAPVSERLLLYFACGSTTFMKTHGFDIHLLN